jgi:hypothetical protein
MKGRAAVNFSLGFCVGAALSEGAKVNTGRKTILVADETNDITELTAAERM